MRIATLAIAFLLTAACSRTVKVQTDPATGRTDIDVQPPGQAEGWTGTINSVGSSGISGNATGSTANDMTDVVLNIMGATPGATYPWHVHDGTCGSAAPIVGAASAYPPLVAGADGRATARAHLMTNLSEARNYIINVHASPSMLGTIVACGDFND